MWCMAAGILPRFFADSSFYPGPENRIDVRDCRNSSGGEAICERGCSSVYIEIVRNGDRPQAGDCGSIDEELRRSRRHIGDSYRTETALRCIPDGEFERGCR